jgi:hypothetical protein
LFVFVVFTHSWSRSFVEFFLQKRTTKKRKHCGLLCGYRRNSLDFNACNRFIRWVLLPCHTGQSVGHVCCGAPSHTSTETLMQHRYLVKYTVPYSLTPQYPHAVLGYYFCRVQPTTILPFEVPLSVVLRKMQRETVGLFLQMVFKALVLHHCTIGMSQW